MLVFIAKAQKSIDVNWEAMPQNAKDFIIQYGLRQKLNDAGSSATVKDLGAAEAGAQSFSMAEGVLASLMSGNVTIRGAGATMTLEERITSRVIRAVFKQVCKRPVAKEVDDSDEALLAEIAQVTGKTVEQVQSAIAKRVEAELLIEKQKAEIPSIDL